MPGDICNRLFFCYNQNVRVFINVYCKNRNCSDKEKVIEYARMRNPKIDIIFISAKTGEGVKELADWILKNTREWIEN